LRRAICRWNTAPTQFPHPVEELLEITGAVLHEPDQRRWQQRRAQPVRQQHRSALMGQVLGGDQTDRQRSHPRSVLRRRADPGREHRARHVPACAAPLPGPVLADGEAHLRQIEHLAGLLADELSVAELAAAGRHSEPARARRHRRAALNKLEMTALMARLPARLTARPASQTLRRRRLAKTL
jgi:hypothetical protein